jgi:two-component system chemotaxis response regulator CheB
MSPAESTMVLASRKSLAMAAPVEREVTPNIDRLFHSAAHFCGSRACAMLLTGMGSDGAEGLLALRQVGALTVAQNEASSTVFGMPRRAIELGAACRVLSDGECAELLAELVRP